MKMTRHFSDTRTQQGRVRFLVCAGGDVHLIAESHGWYHESRHRSFSDAALHLALLPQVPQALYEASLDGLERRQRFFAGGGSGRAA